MAAFINALAEEGTKAECIKCLSEQWHENQRLKSKLAQAERERDEARIELSAWTDKDWDDRDDNLTPEIKASIRKEGYWGTYGEALKLVSNRYSKGAICHLVAHLMMENRSPASPTDTVRQAAEVLLAADEGLDTQPYGYCNGVAWSPGMMEDLRDIAARGGE